MRTGNKSNINFEGSLSLLIPSFVRILVVFFLFLSAHKLFIVLFVVIVIIKIIRAVLKQCMEFY